MNTESLTGQVFGQYELREILGSGGMGAVYKGFQRSLNRHVAVKVLPASLAQEPGFIEHFNREAEISASLEHNHIVPIYDYGVEGKTTYVVMRLLNGGSLAQRLQYRVTEDRPLPSLGETETLLKQVASALDFAHSRNVIHRDIKPGNIMFDQHGSASLVDFGIAKLLSSSTASAHSESGVAGTPAYMSPEQWRADVLTSATDQYSVAVMIYMMLSGHLPFEADSPYKLMNKHLNEAPTALREWRPDLSTQLENAVMRALDKAPERRFPSVTAFANAFSAAASGNAGSPETGFFLFHMRPGDGVTTRPADGGTGGTGGSSGTGGIGRTADGEQLLTYSKPSSMLPVTLVLGLILAALFIGFLVITNLPNANTATSETQVAAGSTASPTAETPTSSGQGQVALRRTSTPGVEPTNGQALAVVTSEATVEPTEAVETARPAATDIPPTSVTNDPTETEAEPTGDGQSALAQQPTVEPSSTAEPSATPVPTDTPVPTETPVPTDTDTPVATDTAVPTDTLVPTDTDTPVPTDTAVPTSTPTPTSTDTATPTETATATSTPTPTETPTPSATPTLDIAETKLLIQGAVFAIGSDSPGENVLASVDPLPRQELYVLPFIIDRHEVTNAEFDGFVSAAGYSTSDFWTAEGWAWVQQYGIAAPQPFGSPDETRLGVSWYEANAYCTWRASRLPSEIEWEIAAQMSIDQPGETYRWGDTLEWTADATASQRYILRGSDQAVRDAASLHARTSAVPDYSLNAGFGFRCVEAFTQG